MPAFRVGIAGHDTTTQRSAESPFRNGWGFSARTGDTSGTYTGATATPDVVVHDVEDGDLVTLYVGGVVDNSDTATGSSITIATTTLSAAEHDITAIVTRNEVDSDQSSAFAYTYEASGTVHISYKGNSQSTVHNSGGDFVDDANGLGAAGSDCYCSTPYTIGTTLVDITFHVDNIGDITNLFVNFGTNNMWEGGGFAYVTPNTIGDGNYNGPVALSAPSGTDDTIRMVADGVNITLYWNGAQVKQFANTTLGGNWIHYHINDPGPRVTGFDDAST